MKQKLKDLIIRSAQRAYDNGSLPSNKFSDVELEEPKVEAHGDYSTNIAMVMASSQKMAPRKIAEAILTHLDDPDNILENTRIAGPGFINFFLKGSSWLPVLDKIHEEESKFGACDLGGGKKIQVEFVSANPTGPLHVGHGRGAAVGDSLARILSFCGYDVTKEYYVNDSGRQIKTLGLSVFLRYKECWEEDIEFPEECYQGEYIRDIAKQVIEKKGKDLLGKDQEEAILYCARLASSKILGGIKKDLESFGVKFDHWYSEQTLYDSGKVDSAIDDFKAKRIIYEKDGALWFKTSDFGDEKDRVVKRSNGLTTYFASDIAYHQDKFNRGFDEVVDIWGADHHGYIPRIAASIEASGFDKDRFKVTLIQLVNLLRDGVPVAMSTRSGTFDTLQDVIDEVDKDAARFIFLTRHHESPLDFDLELAKKKTNDNPVYYVQYVHARISSILRKAEKEKWIKDVARDEKALSMLKEPEDILLMKNMSRYPEVVLNCAKFMEPHRLTFYLMGLASSFHTYYNKHKVLTDDIVLTQGRLYLVLAVQKVIRSGLFLLGVSAPEKM
jgi:arginyl-tRNA synthetase